MFVNGIAFRANPRFPALTVGEASKPMLALPRLEKKFCTPTLEVLTKKLASLKIDEQYSGFSNWERLILERNIKALEKQIASIRA